jgi:hypothetical protein
MIFTQKLFLYQSLYAILCTATSQNMTFAIYTYDLTISNISRNTDVVASIGVKWLANGGFRNRGATKEALVDTCPTAAWGYG